MAELSVQIGADIENLEKALSSLKSNFKGLDSGVKKVNDSVKKTTTSLKTINQSSPVFQKINELTNGLAGNLVDVSEGLKKAGLGAKALKTALLATGIGALVVAIGLIVVYWDDIKEFVTGTNAELERQKSLIQDNVDNLQYQLNLTKSSLSTLELQGKSQKEINNLVKEKLILLLNEKKQLLEISKTQLSGLQKTQERAIKVANIISAGFVATIGTIAKSFDDVLGTDLQGRVIQIKKNFDDIFVGSKAEEAAKEVQGLTIEITKLQNEIDKLTLNNIKIDQNIVLRPKVEAISSIEADNAIKPITTAIKKVKNSSGDTIKIRVKVADENEIKAEVDTLTKPFNEIDFSAYMAKVRQAQAVGKVFADATGSALQSMASSISQSLGITNSIVSSFVSSILSSLASLLTELIATTIKSVAVNQVASTANAITGATQSASATGPGAVFALPAFIALAVGAVVAAFASIGSFYGGGTVSGDRNLVRMNGNEMILNPLQQTALFNQLRNNTPQTSLSGASASNVFSDLSLSTKLRGNDILMTVNRTQRKNKRF